MTDIPTDSSQGKKGVAAVRSSGTATNFFHPFSGERHTVSERVYLDFRRSIATGEFRPGEPLIVRNMAAKFNVSRTPVIEAIRRLERDGLVRVAPKWGATVKDWHWDEIEEAVYIRRALESEAAWLFVERATDEAKRQLRHLNDMFNRCVTEGDMVGCQDTDVEMHLHVARSSRFPRLYELIENSSIERIAIVGLATKRAQNQEANGYRGDLGVHDNLVNALLGLDPEAARDAMMTHIDSSFAYIAEAHRTGQLKSSETVSTKVV